MFVQMNQRSTCLCSPSTRNPQGPPHRFRSVCTEMAKRSAISRVVFQFSAIKNSPVEQGSKLQADSQWAALAAALAERDSAQPLGPCVRDLTVRDRHVLSLGSVPLDSVISRSPGGLNGCFLAPSLQSVLVRLYSLKRDVG